MSTLRARLALGGTDSYSVLIRRRKLDGDDGPPQRAEFAVAC